MVCLSAFMFMLVFAIGLLQLAKGLVTVLFGQQRRASATWICIWCVCVCVCLIGEV